MRTLLLFVVIVSGCNLFETPTPPDSLVSCTNDILDGEETDIDCGGSACSVCETAGSCLVDGDCRSNFCATGKCEVEIVVTPPSCTDGILNGNESDADCGGVCAGCEIGASCGSGQDCRTLNCEDSLCVPDVLCTDGLLNGDETDIDCGGGCPTCETDQTCNVSLDCGSALACVTDRCTPWSDLTQTARISIEVTASDTTSTIVPIRVLIPQVVRDAYPAQPSITIGSGVTDIPFFVEVWNSDIAIVWLALTLESQTVETYVMYFGSGPTTESKMTFSDAEVAWLMADGRDAANTYDFEYDRFTPTSGLEPSVRSSTASHAAVLIPSLNVDGPFSAIVRVRPTNVGESAAMVARASGDDLGDDFYLGVDDLAWFATMNDSEGVLRSTRSTVVPILDEWHDVAMVYDGTEVNLWLNGTVIASRMVERGTTSIDRKVSIGANSNDGDVTFVRNFSGDIADVRLYNRVLSAAEIRVFGDNWKGEMAKVQTVEFRQ